MATLKVTNIKNESFAGDQLYLKSDGYLGIGTTSPGHKLVISQTNSGGIAAIHLPIDESTILGPNANTYLKMGGNVVLGANGQLDFSTSGTSKLTIKNDGKVGIGTTSPVGLLELDGASSAFTLQLKETSGAYHRMGFKKNNNLFQLGEFSNDGTTFTPILNLDANGDKIGIGESSPDHIFHIKGSTPILAVESNSWVSGVSAALRLSYTDGNAREIRGHYDHGLQFTTNQGEAFRIKTDGNVSVLLGNIEIGTAGKGIDFSATSDATGKTSELLDDYEEGTWTPVLASTGTAFTSVTNWSSSSQNRYTKIGRIVTIQCYHRTGGVDKGSAASTDGIEMTGLPFTPTNVVQRSMVPIGQNVNWAGYPNHALVRENIASVELYKSASSGGNNTGTPLTVADVGTAANNNYAIFTLVYESA